MVFFDHILTLRSYSETNELISLGENKDLYIIFVASDRRVLINTNTLNGLRIHGIYLNRIYQFLLNINSTRYWILKKSKSRSFESRIRSIRMGRREFYESNSKFNFKAPTSLWIGYLLSFMSFNRMSVILKPVVKKLFADIDLDNVDTVLYVGTGGSLFLSDCIALQIQRTTENTKYIFNSENWDNLPSKAVFNLHPDRLGVWGKKGIKYAAQIHGVDESKIRSVGSPRVDYLASEMKSNSMQVNEDNLKVLFMGGSLDFHRDVTFFLESREILSERYYDYELLYLPHPKNYLKYQAWNINEQKSDSIQGEIDELIKLCIEKEQLPSLEFYVKLFSDCKLTLSPLSTMNLESLLYGIPTIALDFRENALPTSPWATEYFEHFSELINYSGVKIARSKDELAKAVYFLLDSRIIIRREEILDYDLDKNFRNKLLSLICYTI